MMRMRMMVVLVLIVGVRPMINEFSTCDCTEANIKTVSIRSQFGETTSIDWAHCYAIKCGADKRQTAVDMTANVENRIKHNRSITIAANFHSPIMSDRSSSRRYRLVMKRISCMISQKKLCDCAAPVPVQQQQQHWFPISSKWLPVDWLTFVIPGPLVLLLASPRT